MRKRTILLFPLLALILVGMFSCWQDYRARTREREYVRILFRYSDTISALNAAIQDYSRTHFAAAPPDITAVVESNFDRFQGMNVEIINRVQFIPDVTETEVGRMAWALAVVIPKQGPMPSDLISVRGGPGLASDSDFSFAATREVVAKALGDEFVRSVEWKNLHPEKLTVAQLDSSPVKEDARNSSGYLAPLRWVVNNRQHYGLTSQSGEVAQLPLRLITQFERPLDFATGEWAIEQPGSGRLQDSYGFLRFTNRMPNGSVGQDSVRMSLAAFRDDCPKLIVEITPSNQAKSLSLVLIDQTGRRAEWIFDLRLASPYEALTPRGGAALSSPTIAPADGQPLDLSHITSWELRGDPSDTAPLHLDVKRIVVWPRMRTQ